MTTRTLSSLAFALLLIAGGCGDDDPTGPGSDHRTGLDLDDFAAGDLSTVVTGGWLLDVDGNDPGVDAPGVVELGAGDMALCDPDPQDLSRASVTIETAGQRLFRFGSIDVADRSGDADTAPNSEVRVRGYLRDELMGTEFYGAISAAAVSHDAGSLAGVDLSRLEIDVYSTGGDDFCVPFLELDPLPVVLVDFADLPLGEFEHLNVGEFELTWDDDEFQQEVVAHSDGRSLLTDPVTDDVIGAAVLVERLDGASFSCDALYAADLLGPDPLSTHIDSRILVEGMSGGVVVGSDLFTPVDTLALSLAADGLRGLEVDALRLSVLSVCAVFRCDDFGVAGLLLAVSE